MQMANSLPSTQIMRLEEIARKWARQAVCIERVSREEVLEAVRSASFTFPLPLAKGFEKPVVRLTTIGEVESLSRGGNLRWPDLEHPAIWPESMSPFVQGEVRGRVSWILAEEAGGYLRFLQRHGLMPEYTAVVILEFLLHEMGHAIPGAEAMLAAARLSGGWLVRWGENEIRVLERPTEIHLQEERLHAETGPAIKYPDGGAVWALRGMVVPRRVVENPESLTVAEIREERNVELRRLMLDRFGRERYLRESGATVLHQDEWGTLYRADIPGDEPLVMVEVVNSTPEPDGSFKDYMIRVDPRCRTAREAVAWTFGKSPDAYSPTLET